MNDAQVRAEVFRWLGLQTDGGRRPISWQQLTSGFLLDGEPLILIGAKGIWKPRQLALPISILTSGDSPYDDRVETGGLLRYSYEGTEPNGYRNVWLREAKAHRRPLVYLHGIGTGWYMATWPAYVVEDRPDDLAVLVALADPETFSIESISPESIDMDAARYHARLARVRVDQGRFRHGVMRAYKHQCAVCSLKHLNLLDAAHIRPHALGGASTTPNGLSLCKIHHAAFDHNILGVDPGYQVHIREDVLDEVDGPMLRHGIQEMNGRRLLLPRALASRPDPEAIEERFERFRSH